MNDCVASASEFIKNITIEGWVRPTLKFNWSNMMFIDRITQVKVILANEVAISWYEGMKLRKIFKKKFIIHPVYEKNGKIRRIMIEKQKDKEGMEEIKIE